MPTLTRERIRLALEATHKSTSIDKLTASAPVIWRGVDLAIELAFFFRGALLDLSNVTSVRLQLKPGTNRLGAALLDKTLLFASLNTGLTQNQWDTDAAEHAQFTLTNAETDIAIGANEKQYWLVASATLNDGNRITFGAAKLTIKEDGV